MKLCASYQVQWWQTVFVFEIATFAKPQTVIGYLRTTNRVNEKNIDHFHLFNMDAFIRSQIAKAPAEQMKQKYQLDVNNAEQMNQFVSAQVEQQSKSFVVNKKIRDHVFNSSLNTSFILILIAAGYFLCQPY